MKDFLWVPIGTVGAFAGMLIMVVQSARSFSSTCQDTQLILLREVGELGEFGLHLRRIPVRLNME